MIFLAIYAGLAVFALLISACAVVLVALFIRDVLGGIAAIADSADMRTHNLPDLLGEHGSQDGARGIHNKRGDK